MKTKNLLFAMALPTLFAACTAEEIVNQADNSAVLENRALLGDLVVNMESPVASRASWSEENLAWGAWEEDDAFSGALVDATPGTVDNSLLTNYVYKKNAAGEWTTTSQMVEGIYSFYSYKGITAKNDRKPVAFDLTAQVADLDNPTKVIDDNQLFFSPLYNVEAKNTTAENNIALPLTFYPYHSIAALKMTNATGQTLLISQIIANGTFAAKGAILPSKINAQEELNWYVRKGEKTYKVQPKAFNEDGSVKTEYTATEIEKIWQTADLDNIGGKGELANSKVLTMDCANWEWADGEEIMAYMVIPAGSKVTGVDINVVDEEGEAKVINVAESKGSQDADKKIGIASTGISKQTFKRSIPVSMFGYTSTGAPKGITAKAENLKDNSGYYVSNKEDLIALINVSRGDIMVYNYGELVVDAEIAEVIAEYTGGVVTFTNDIDIKDLEAEKVVIENIVFGDNATDVVTVKEGTTVEFKNAKTNLLNIEAGATVTIKAGTYGNIQNEGTLSVEALKVDDSNSTIAAGTITTTGALTVKGYDQTVVLKEGSVEYVAIDIHNNGTAVDAFDVTGLTVARTADKNASIKIGSKVTWIPAEELTYAQAFTEAVNADGEGKGTIANKLSVIVDGEVDSEVELKIAELTVNGKFTTSKMLNVVSRAENNGEIDLNDNKMLISKGSVLKNAGSLYNNGDIYGTVVAYGTGYVEAAEGSSMTLGKYGNVGYARVNNTAGGNVQIAAGDYTVYYQFDEDFNLADLNALDTELYNINTIVINSKFTMDANDMVDVTPNWTEFYTNVTAVEFLNGSEVYVKPTDDYTYEFPVAKMSVAGNVKIHGWSAEQSKAAFNANPTITMAASSVLTLDKITLNASSAKVIGIAPVAGSGQVNAKVVVRTSAKLEGTITYNSYAGQE